MAPIRHLTFERLPGKPAISKLSASRFVGFTGWLMLPTYFFGHAKVFAGPYSPLPGQGNSIAIPATSTSIVEWATGATIVRGARNIENPTEYSSDPNSPLNHAFYGGSDGASAAANAASLAAGGTGVSSTTNAAPIGEPTQPQGSYYAVSLGQNGSATLSFNQPITNGPGPDFAVFNNGFSSGSQEWVKPALVAVSSDDVHFFQFPSVSLTQTTTQVGNYSELDPTNLYDIAGNFPAGYGTPFDLSELVGVSPLLNFNAVTEVRVIGIPGDINPTYAAHDSQGHIINSPFPAASTSGSEGFGLAGVGVVNEVVASQPPNLSWSNAAQTGIWNIGADLNWNTPGVAYHDGDYVTFDNSMFTADQTVTLNTTVAPGSMTVNTTTGNYTISGTGGIAGATGLIKSGTKTLKLAVANSYSGATVVNGGTLELAVTGALPANSALTIAGGGKTVVDIATGPLVFSSLNLDPANTGSPAGKIDLTDNGLVIHNGDISAITADIEAGAQSLSWNGTSGITSSTAAADTSHLTAVGVMQNGTAADGVIYSSAFDGTTGLNLATTDVLVRYTWYGDANLDGQVDGSDYTEIDGGFNSHGSLTGWQDGDFNYDGVIDGSDYTLIDNAFDNQSGAMNALIAEANGSVTAQVGSGASVPEPASCVVACALTAVTFGRRRRVSG